jgi:hypothetical protein
VDAVAIHVGGMTEADVMIANQLTLDIAIQQSGERILVENGKGAEETMCGERGGDNGEDVRKENRRTRMWMSPREGEGGRWLSSNKRARVIIAQTLPIDRED